jgi:hypothetical protein
MRQFPQMMDAMVDLLAAQKEKSGKPFLAITHPSHVEDVMAEIRGRLLERGVGAFTSFQAAARALSKAIDCWQTREELA